MVLTLLLGQDLGTQATANTRYYRQTVGVFSPAVSALALQSCFRHRPPWRLAAKAQAMLRSVPGTGWAWSISWPFIHSFDPRKNSKAFQNAAYAEGLASLVLMALRVAYLKVTGTMSTVGGDWPSVVAFGLLPILLIHAAGAMRPDATRVGWRDGRSLGSALTKAAIALAAAPLLLLAAQASIPAAVLLAESAYLLATAPHMALNKGAARATLEVPDNSNFSWMAQPWSFILHRAVFFWFAVGGFWRTAIALAAVFLTGLVMARGLAWIQFPTWMTESASRPGPTLRAAFLKSAAPLVALLLLLHPHLWLPLTKWTPEKLAPPQRIKESVTQPAHQDPIIFLAPTPLKGKVPGEGGRSLEALPARPLPRKVELPTPPAIEPRPIKPFLPSPALTLPAPDPPKPISEPKRVGAVEPTMTVRWSTPYTFYNRKTYRDVTVSDPFDYPIENVDTVFGSSSKFIVRGQLSRIELLLEKVETWNKEGKPEKIQIIVQGIRRDGRVIYETPEFEVMNDIPKTITLLFDAAEFSDLFLVVSNYQVQKRNTPPIETPVRRVRIGQVKFFSPDHNHLRPLPPHQPFRFTAA